MHQNQVQPLVKVAVEVFDVRFEHHEEVEDHDENDDPGLVQLVGHRRNL